jgi:hypothetical protein
MRREALFFMFRSYYVFNLKGCLKEIENMKNMRSSYVRNMEAMRMGSIRTNRRDLLTGEEMRSNCMCVKTIYLLQREMIDALRDFCEDYANLLLACGFDVVALNVISLKERYERNVVYESPRNSFFWGDNCRRIIANYYDDTDIFV